MQIILLKTALLLGFCTYLLTVAASAQSPESIYTDIDAKKCKTIEKGREYVVQKCAGIAGYNLLVSEDDLRQNITIIDPKGKKHSLNLYQTISSSFSYLGTKAEWRVVKKQGKITPVALIVRFIASENPEDASKTTSYLAVAKITPASICVTDKIPPGKSQNQDARLAADVASNKACIE